MDRAIKKAWVLAAALSWAGFASAATVTLDWNAVTTNADATPIMDLAGYQVFYATYSLSSISTTTALGAASVTKPSFAGNVLTQTISTLSDGTTYFFRITARDTTGNHSDLCDLPVEVSTFTPPPTPPTSVTSLTATTLSTIQIRLNWTDAVGETSYRIEQSINGGVSFTTVTAGVAANAVTYTVGNLTASTDYAFRVISKNAVGETTSASVSARTNDPPSTPPAAPSGVGAAANSTTQITVSWTDNSTDEDTFEIVRSLSASMTSPSTTTVPAGTVSQPIPGLTAGTTYFFKVRAVNAAGASSLVPATPVSRMTLSVAPNAPTFPSVSSNTITLSWNNVAGEDGYRIERSLTSGSGYSQIAQVGINVTSFQDPTVLNPNTYYYYRVRAFNSAGNSTYSTESFTRTLAGAGPSGFSVPPGLREAYCFPNPARGVDPTIRSLMGGVDSVEVTIFDQSGRTVHSGRTSYPTNVNGEIAFDYTWTGEKAPGVYYAIIHGKKGDETIRARAKFAVVR